MQLPHNLETQAWPSALVRWLGYGGLVPFVGGALGVGLLNAPHSAIAANALASYGATIGSFLGAIYWGLGMRETAPGSGWAVWGVTPSLVAWVALQLPSSPGMVVLGLLLLTCYAVDRKAYPRYALAHWLPMRLHLTVIASLALFSAALLMAVPSLMRHPT